MKPRVTTAAAQALSTLHPRRCGYESWCGRCAALLDLAEDDVLYALATWQWAGELERIE